MDNFQVRKGSMQKSVNLPEGATIAQVLQAAREAGMDIANPPEKVNGYVSNISFSGSDLAPTNEVIVVS